MCLTTEQLTHILILIYRLLCFKKYELGIVAPRSLFWARESVECNMTKANSMTHQTFCSGSIVLKGSSVCQTWKSFKVKFPNLLCFFCGLVFDIVLFTLIIKEPTDFRAHISKDFNRRLLYWCVSSCLTAFSLVNLKENLGPLWIRRQPTCFY